MSGGGERPQLCGLRVVRGPLGSPASGPGVPTGGGSRAALLSAKLDPDQVAGTLGVLAARLSEALGELRDLGICRPPVTGTLADALAAMEPVPGPVGAAAQEALRLAETVAFDIPVAQTRKRMERARQRTRAAQSELGPTRCSEGWSA